MKTPKQLLGHLAVFLIILIMLFISHDLWNMWIDYQIDKAFKKGHYEERVRMIVSNAVDKAFLNLERSWSTNSTNLPSK